MRFALLMILLGSLSGRALDGQITPIESRDVSKSVPVFRPSSEQSKGQARLQARSIAIEATMPNGITKRGEVFVIFDPVAGFFQWFLATGVSNLETTDGYLPVFASGEWATFAEKDALTIFQFAAMPPFVAAIQSHSRASSAIDAEAKALGEATKALSDQEGRSRPKEWHRVPLLSLGKEFVIAPGRPVPGPMTILAVMKQDGNWEITLQGQWKEKILLNDKFELVSLTRVD